MRSVDVVIVGAGAAGIAAGLDLAGSGLRFVILEAAERVGGRAFTDAASLPVPWDQGCHWLHSADVNPLVAWADRLGARYAKETREDHFAIWRGGRFAAAEDLADARACTLAAFEAIERAHAEGRDVAIQETLPDSGRWSAPLRCVLQMMAAADPEAVSAVDYAASEDTDVNWPVTSGYGALIARMAEGLPIRLGVAATAIEQRARSVTVHTRAGAVEAGAAIVTVSTNVLASGALRFSPGPAADLLDAVADLPCGLYEKAALVVDDLPPEAVGKIFCMVDPGDGRPAIDFQIMATTPPVMVAHMAGDSAAPILADGAAGLIAQATDRLTLAFGARFRTRIRAAAASGWARDPLIRGAYSHARPGAAFRRTEALQTDTGSVLFAGEAFSGRWAGAAHGAYQSGRDAARRLAERWGRAPRRPT